MGPDVEPGQETENEASGRVEGELGCVSTQPGKKEKKNARKCS